MRKTRGLVIADKGRLEIRDDCALPDKVNSLGAVIRPSIWSICISDVLLCQTGCRLYPYLIGRPTGHEMCGVIEEIGEDVEDFKVGDRVIVCTKMPNWRSLEAQDGYYRANCDNVFCGNPGIERGGSFVDHYYIKDADMNLALIPDNVTMEQAVIATDMMGTSFQGAEEAEIRLGDSVAVFGLGAVGQMAVAAAVLKGAGRVFGIDSRKVRLEMAKEYGCTCTFDYHDKSFMGKILELNNNRPVDAVIMAGGSSDSVNEGLTLLKRGGVLVNLSKYMNEDFLRLDMIPWNGGTGGKTIKTSSCAGGRAFITRMLNLIQCGRVAPEKIITHRFHGMEQIPQVFELYEKREPDLIKAIVYND